MNMFVDLIVAVHDPRRPVLRAIDSVAASGRADVRVTVVCHGISPDAVSGLRERESDLVRLVEFTDGIASPAGPFNHGIDLATATYVGVMGSDDWLDPGALDEWIGQLQRRRLDVLLAGMKHQSGQVLRNPPVRPWRRNGLDTAKDRLFHRAAPLGLIRRTLLERPRLRFAEGLPTGEDIPFSVALFAAAQRIGVAFGSRRYVIGTDAVDRVTGSRHSITTVLAPVKMLFESDWFGALPERLRTAAVIARLRGSLIADVTRRRAASDWNDGGLTEVGKSIAAAKRLAPRAFDPLSRADRNLLDELELSVTNAEQAMAAVSRWAGAGRKDRLIPHSIFYALHRESALVKYAGYGLARFGA